MNAVTLVTYHKNGKGEISFKKDYKLVWTDSMQHFADSFTFSRTA